MCKFICFFIFFLLVPCKMSDKHAKKNALHTYLHSVYTLSYKVCRHFLRTDKRVIYLIYCIIIDEILNTLSKLFHHQLNQIIYS